MKTPSSLSVPVLLAVPALLALHPRADELSFQPAEGARLAKEMELEMSFALEDISITMDGQELPAEMMGEGMDDVLVLNAVIGVTDEYVKSARGKHLELLRTYDEISMEGGTEGALEPAEGMDDFEGSTVRFKWDEESAGYVVTMEDGAGDEDALEDLTPDMDFLALLPDGEVDVDDTWTVSGERLSNVFLPGGMFPIPSDGEDEEMSQVIEDELKGQLEEAFKDFEVVCTYKGSRDGEDGRVGEIALKFDGKASIDLSDLIAAVIDMQAEGQEMDMDADIVASLDLEFSGEGALLWNLAAHRMDSFNMSSDMTLLVDVEADLSVMGESHSGALSAELSGDGTWSMTAKKPE